MHKNTMGHPKLPVQRGVYGGGGGDGGGGGGGDGAGLVPQPETSLAIQPDVMCPFGTPDHDLLDDKKQ